MSIKELKGNKNIIGWLREQAGFEGKVVDIRLFKKDRSALKYVTRALDRPDFILTKRTIAELSPWNIRMVKTILKKDIKDISSGLKELLERGATPHEIQQAFSFSAAFTRLAKMDYLK